MIRVGITGKNGFVGYHLHQTLKLLKEDFTLVEFDRSFFDDNEKLDYFVSSCDVIVHLAALNRHENPQVIYDINIALVIKLIDAFNRTSCKPHIIISSSTQEDRDNLYGISKLKGRLLLSDWSNSYGGCLTGLIIPNVFGPFGKPFYNSVIATFCHQITRNEPTKIDVDVEINLIYVGDLVDEIIKLIKIKDNSHRLEIKPKYTARVSEVLKLLQNFRAAYQNNNEIPSLHNDFEKKLFNTFRCYIDIKNYFPRSLVPHSDNRGSFVEVARHGISGQTSFSTTLPGITRGNHFHTRKIERFAVIKGKALIQLRKIGTNEVHDFYLDENSPSFVDMPIWYTHNIKNVGEDPLYTIFWINEPFNSQDPDTFFEIV